MRYPLPLIAAAIVSVFSVGAFGPVRADYQRGLDLWDRGEVEAAVIQFRAAANRGDPRAQDQLGVMYEEGQGLARDDVSAVYWYDKAAKAGYPPAQHNLARMYRNGRGVDRDEAKAVHWYTQAAERGLPVAQFFLGLMYDTGKGVPADPMRAYMWFSLAAAQGDQDARFKRDRIQARLSEAQIEQAERLGAAIGPMQAEASASSQHTRPPASTYAQPAGAPSSSVQMSQSGSAPIRVHDDRALDRDGIRELQQRLAAAGFDPGPADGLPGPRTRSALTAFQRRHALVESGRMTSRALRQVRDPNADSGAASGADSGRGAAPQRTRTRIAPSPRPTTLTATVPPRGAALIEAVQRELAALGFDPGPIDGMMGSRTRQAVRAFASKTGRTAGEQVTPELLVVLQAEGRAQRELSAAAARTEGPPPAAAEVPAPVAAPTPVVATPPPAQAELPLAKTIPLAPSVPTQPLVAAPATATASSERVQPNPFKLEGESLVREFQIELTRLGYDVGEIDGLIGRRTVDAVKAFQAVQGWRTTGRLVPAVLRRMQQAPTPGQVPTAAVTATPMAASQPAPGPAPVEGRATVSSGSVAPAAAVTASNVAPPAATEVPAPVRVAPDEGVLAVGGTPLILTIQRRLNQLGYDPGVPDGLVGSRTVAATRAFQRSIRRPANGILGNRLLRQLDDAIARGGLTRESVRVMQRRLQALGYDVGTADGFIGPKTADAVRAFQQRRGMEVDGRASQALLDTLNAQ